MAVYIPQDLRAPLFKGHNWVRFTNSTGELIPPHAVMRITGWSASNGAVVYTVAKPSTTFCRRYLVNGPIAVGSATTHEGWGTFLGEGGPVMISSGIPSEGEEWGATSGQWYLTQNRPGFLAAGSTTTTSGGSTVLIANQLVVQVAYGKADSAINKNSSGTVRVYGGAFGSESDTSQTIASCYNKTANILDEAEVTVAWPNGKALVANLVCT